MKPNVFNPLLSSATAIAFLLGMASSQAEVTLYAEYRLGEALSLSGANKLPQDSSGNAKHFTADIGGSAATVGTAGVYAAGSTAYVDTTAAGNQGWFANNLLTTGTVLPTDNFAFGIYARAAGNTTATVGEVFTLNGTATGTPKLSLTTSGWQASFNNVAFVGGTAAFAANTWVHLALIRSGGNTGFYVDGVQVGGTIANTPVLGSPHMGINPGNTGNTFDGQIDEARIVTFASGEPIANILTALTTVYVPPVEPAGDNGTWSSTVDGIWGVGSNWQSGVIATSSNNTATFSSGSGPIAVTLDSSRSIGNLVFSNADYTIGGVNVLTLNSASTPGISVDTNRNATLATNMGGTLGFEKTGPGTLTLSGLSNSNAGATTISGGTLKIGDGGTTGSLGSGNVAIAGNLTFNRSNNYGTGAGQVFSGAGTITKNGAGDLVFNGGSDHTNVQGISNVVVNDGLIRTDYWGQWNSALNLTVNGLGKFEMWNTTVSIGNLSGNGTVQNTKNWGRNYTLTVAAGSFSGTITDSGITSGAAGTGAGDTRIKLIKSGPGTLTLSGVTSYTGSTTVAEGTLSLGNGATSTNLSDAADVSIAFGSTVNLNFTGSDVVGKLIIDGSTLPPGVYDSSVATPVEYRSYFTGTGSLTVLSQSGTWISTVDGNWSASSNWQAGVIASGFDKTATFSAGSGPIAVTLDSSRIIGSLVFSIAEYTIGGSNMLTLDSSSTPVISVDTGRTATLATNIGGTVGFEKTGLGTLTLSASNIYTGDTTISGGALQIGGGGRLGGGNYNNAISIATGAALQYSSSASQTLSGLITGAGRITKDTSNSDLALSNTGNDYTGTTTVSAGRLAVTAATHLSSGATSIVQSGTGQIAINAATISNPFSLSTTGYNEGDTRSNIMGAIRMAGGTLSGQITLSGTSRIGGFLGASGVQVNTINGKITGGFGIDFYGMQNVNNTAQVFTLSNTSNDYTGDTSILNGTFNNFTNLTNVSTILRLGASGVIPDGASAGNVVFAIPHTNDNATTVLDLNGFNETINGLTVNAGTFTKRITNDATGASVLTIGANDTTSEFSGTVTDAGVGKTLAITKIGTGTLTLSGITSYRGNTNVSNGTLTLDNPNPNNETSTVTIAASGAKLQLSFAATDTVEKLFIGSTQQAIGEYGHTDSGATNGGAGVGAMNAYFAPGTGKLNVTSATPTGGFSAWQTANSTTQTIDLDHDSDGVSNGVEYFLFGPVSTTGFTALPGVTNTAGTLSVTWTKAAGYTGTYGTDFVVETSSTLATGSWMPETLGGTMTITGNDVKYTFPAGTKNFARLKVTGP